VTEFKRNNVPELLAPAGGMPQLMAALHFGADAVYGGMQRYGLRAFAGNFTEETLPPAVKMCHEKGKKFYLTINIFPFDEDLKGLLSLARFAFECGVDAAIVSDIGAVTLLREELPGLPIHISTQANTLNSRTASFWHGLGAQRVILAREMTIDQIATLRQNTPLDLELEAFVHGAACMAYSGRCLLSNFMTGRGANQGACAQPCRWRYHVVEEKRPGEYFPVCEDENGTYIFSAQDINAMALLPKLKKCGLSSLKIEGRMKTEYYVATVVSAYRRGLDALQKGEEAFYELLPELALELNKASHRPGNTGFFLGTPKICGGAEGFTQSMEYAGRVVSNANAGEEAAVELKNRFYAGDDLEVLTPSGSQKYKPESIVLKDTGEAVKTHGVAGTLLTLVFPFDVSEGDILRGPVRNHAQA
jgi:putative protease